MKTNYLDIYRNYLSTSEESPSSSSCSKLRCILSSSLFFTMCPQRPHFSSCANCVKQDKHLLSARTFTLFFGRTFFLGSLVTVFFCRLCLRLTICFAMVTSYVLCISSMMVVVVVDGCTLGAGLVPAAC